MDVEMVVEPGTESGIWRFAGQLSLGMGFSGQKGQAEPCQGHENTVWSEETILEKEKKRISTQLLEPGPIQVYSYLDQLKWTHQKFGAARDSTSKPRAHI